MVWGRMFDGLPAGAFTQYPVGGWGGVVSREI